MCPLVAGLSREAGEFVLTRLSQIAMSAHAPLGSATCKPNLFVLVANESAIVVVDPVQVSKLNIGQLADYIGLVGLAEINLDKDLGEAPSILKVFAASEMAPQPLEMTTWDKALLQALYATSQDNRLQLSKIKRETLELIAAK